MMMMMMMMMANMTKRKGESDDTQKCDDN